jgi:hypothetical protein
MPMPMSPGVKKPASKNNSALHGANILSSDQRKLLFGAENLPNQGDKVLSAIRLQFDLGSCNPLIAVSLGAVVQAAARPASLPKTRAHLLGSRCTGCRVAGTAKATPGVPRGNRLRPSLAEMIAAEPIRAGVSPEAERSPFSATRMTALMPIQPGGTDLRRLHYLDRFRDHEGRRPVFHVVSHTHSLPARRPATFPWSVPHRLP